MLDIVIVVVGDGSNRLRPRDSGFFRVCGRRATLLTKARVIIDVRTALSTVHFVSDLSKVEIVGP